MLQEIYVRYGYYQTALKSISMPCKDGMEKMAVLLANIRKNPPKKIHDQELIFDDFKNGLFGLPKSDVLRFKSENYRIIVRPSGTEPKIKIYMQARGATPKESSKMIEEMNSLVENLMK